MSIMNPGYTVGAAQFASKGGVLPAEQANADDRSNATRTQPAGRMQYMSVAKQAEADLRPFLAEVGDGLERKAEVIAKALATQHCTWGNAVLGLAQWCWDDWENFSARLTGLKLTVGQLTKLKRALRAEQEKAMAPPTRCAVTVRCDAIVLKLSLTPKFMTRSLADAVLTPYLKAFSKKVGADPALTPADLESVELQGQMTLPVTDFNKTVAELARSEEHDLILKLKPANWRDMAAAPAGAEALADID